LDLENYQSGEVNEEYASDLRQAFRELTGWQVAKDTRIWNHLTEFSKGYSREKRNVTEVAAIFAFANDIQPKKCEKENPND
jgi:hypothetical protein